MSWTATNTTIISKEQRGGLALLTIERNGVQYNVKSRLQGNELEDMTNAKLVKNILDQAKARVEALEAAAGE